MTLRNRFAALRAAMSVGLTVPADSLGGQMLSAPAGVGGPPTRGTSQMLSAYSTSPWLRAVVSRIAAGVAACRWKLYVVGKPGDRARKDVAIQTAGWQERKGLCAERVRAGDLVLITDHPLLTALDRGGPYLTGQANRKLAQIYLDLVGECALLKERNALGKPAALWPIPPDWIAGTPTPARPAFRISHGGWQAEIPASEILWMIDPDPANPYGRGSGQAGAASDELDTDEFAAKHTRQFFANRARPDLIVTPKGADASLTPEQTKRLELEWTNRHQGFWRQFKPLFLSREVAIKELTQDFAALQMVELRQHERDMIIQVTGGIPPEKLGIVANSNRATIEGADLIFAKDVLVPRLEFLRAYFQEFLVPEYDERLIVDYVNPVADDPAFRLSAMQAAPAAPTVDEWRRLQGLPPMTDGTGTHHVMPLGARLGRLRDEADIRDD